jgi:hypothetical protein
MKQKKQLQTEALARREKNVAAYKSGNIGSLNIPVDTDKHSYLEAKLKVAEKDVEELKSKLGIRE